MKKSFINGILYIDLEGNDKYNSNDIEYVQGMFQKAYPEYRVSIIN